MSNDFEFIKEYMKKENEERNLREQEAQIRYADRRAEKMAHRRRIEEAAGRICDMVIAETGKETEARRPEEITALAAALVHVSMALQTAEGYAESRPFYGGGFMLGGGVRA